MGSAVFLLLLVIAAAPLSAAQLFTGVSHTVNAPPQIEETLFNDFTFTIVPTVSKVTIDLETDDPSHDLDLFVQFARPVTVADNGDVSADFSSETTASGIEQIVIDSTTDPPLETGVYHLAILVKTLNTPISGKLRISVVGGSPPATFSISTFASGTADGWQRNFPSSPLPGSAPGDFAGVLTVQPGEFLRLDDLDGPNQDFVVAPTKFYGNLAAFSSARFELDYRHATGSEALIRIEMRILGANAAFRWLGPVPPMNEWIHLVVTLDPSNWTRLAGTASFEDVLRRLERIELSMDQAPGAEANDLDNFAFFGQPPAPPTGSPPGPLSSLFETDLDEWTRNFPAVGIPGATAGNPDSSIRLSAPGFDSDGFLLLSDAGGRGEDYLVLPEKYLGNLALLDRPWFEFDYRKIEGQFSRLPLTMRLIGRGTTYIWTGLRPRDVWLHSRAPLLPEYWLKFEGEASFDQVLANVERIELSMDVADGLEVNGLDNFYLRTEFTPPSGRAMQVSRESILLTGTSGGPPFSPQPFEITATGAPVTWSASVSPVDALWLSVTPDSGSTPGNAEILVNPSGLPPGEHTASVVIRSQEPGVPPRAIEVTVVLDAQTNAPRINTGGVVHVAASNLRLSAGGLASIYGVRLAPGSQEAGFVEGNRLPQELLGVEVLVRTSAGTTYRAPLLYVSAGQINFQMPFEVAGLPAVQIIARSNGLESPPEGVILVAAGAGLFVLSGDRAAVLNQDFTVNTPAQPAQAGSVILAFLTGVGSVEPAVPSGTAAPSAPLSNATLSASARLGGVDARVLSLVLVPGFVGLAQANIEVPALPSGEHQLTIEMGGQVSNGGLVSVR
jgi:uncharacterized protein (TIGR03437 family)